MPTCMCAAIMYREDRGVLAPPVASALLVPPGGDWAVGAADAE